MFKGMMEEIKSAAILFVVLTLITGFIYPLLVTAIAQLFFPWQANGSLIMREGQSIGSLHIGQYFYSSKYFWGRPSATQPFPYNGASSAGSNSGPTNPRFLLTVQERAHHLMLLNGQNQGPVPVDLVTASGSGLDPEISLYAAYYQVPRIAKVRKISESEIISLIEAHAARRILGVIGEPRINVLQLNLALDQLR